ncbi:MAG TPA: DEAD/DEAH box helicase [Rhizomicrobium sp.]|jgi:superfamily II DNA or RNA helicase|nr:DEAD/DEAH box helicase [Rhizomicrobium sp.]
MPANGLAPVRALPGITPPKSRTPKNKRGKRARKVLEKPARLGWQTSDEEEVELRRWRGETEIGAIEPLEPEHQHFGCFRVRSGSGGSYDVEIRSFDGFINSCGCIDHRVNGLGTCKHIEGVLAALKKRGPRSFREAALRGSERVEIFLDRQAANKPAIVWPAGNARAFAAAREFLARHVGPNGSKIGDYGHLQALVAAWPGAPAELRRHLRVSTHMAPWLERLRRQRSRLDARMQFLAEVNAGRESFDMLKHPLLPYQRDGMLHLAFGERALLADEMGLGKTIQAIAACELLARRGQASRVLVVCPASLKAEWEEQIARFCERRVRLVFGPRAERRRAYGERTFFTIVNYEQVLSDADDINAVAAPDVVVLDEAQRIKNWHTKTARCVKSLRSPYAFVLTGTPIENRIDELYSILQYLDPEILGPLFRFNRDFYELDGRGRPVDYKNLGELRERVSPLILRRRKSDVETQLPARTVKNYFVPMADEQRARYQDYETPASILLALARRRPLTPAEFDRMMMLLACMRMVCDTPAILDPTCRVSPKLEELENILSDLLEEPDRKVIVFSEWERMLQMVRDLAAEMGVECAWHTGSVPQARRRLEINRFKQDPACRLFLSTDSGSVGLNLQVASAVVNVDLPWNPAKLEQRIARAWRKNQMRSVTVANLVCEESIEHNILHLLASKQAVADGVLDGHGDLSKLKMPSGRGAFLERMQAMMGPRARTLSVEEQIVEDLRTRHGARALHCEVRTRGEGGEHVLAVLDLDSSALAVEAVRMSKREGTAPPVELISRETWDVLQRLAASGLMQFAGSSPRVLFSTQGGGAG